MLFLSCFCYAFVRVCLLRPCGHFPIGILGQVWCLIVSIPDLCLLSYFYKMDVVYMYLVM